MNKLEKKKTVVKPWGREIWFALVPGKYMGKVLEIEPDQQVSLHLHKFKEETMFLYQGEMELHSTTAGMTLPVRIVKAGEFIHIVPQMKHSMKSIGDVKAVLFEVSTPYPDDSIRIEDYYGRPANNYRELDDLADSIGEKK